MCVGGGTLWAALSVGGLPLLSSSEATAAAVRLSEVTRTKGRETKKKQFTGAKVLGKMLVTGTEIFEKKKTSYRCAAAIGRGGLLLTATAVEWLWGIRPESHA